MKVNLNDDLKLSPSSLTHFIWWFWYNSVRILVTLVQLEVDFLHVGLHVFVLLAESENIKMLLRKMKNVFWSHRVRLNVNCPLMSVAVLISFLSKGSRNIAIDNRLHLRNSLQKVKGCRFVCAESKQDFSLSLCRHYRDRNLRALIADSFHFTAIESICWLETGVKNELQKYLRVPN